MSKKHGDRADAASARNAAAAAQTEDPMTSLDPEADKAKAEADQDSESVPAERAPRGNGAPPRRPTSPAPDRDLADAMRRIAEQAGEARRGGSHR